MWRFVIDTNFFINLQRPLNLGSNKEEVVQSLSILILPLIKNGQLELLTTPESFKELESFFVGQPNELATLNNLLTISSPNYSQLKISAHLFAELIAETGRRLYRGLRVAEELLKNQPTLTNNSSGEYDNPAISQLRDKYRRATREGFIDSTTDLGLIFLGVDRNAPLVTTDAGLIHWARQFGCSEILPEVFVNKLKTLT